MKIDLRSDTVTKPTAGMIQAMMQAEVGDDVFAEDPTVAALEQQVATLFNQEAGLFCPSGTMANLIALKAHTQPFDEIILADLAHIYHYEVGGYAALAGVSVKLLPTQYGIILPEQVIENIQPHHDWTTRTTLLAIENTVNKGGGAIYTLENMQKLSAICKENKLAFHLDGARIFNACTAASYTPQEVGRLFDSISICFSKGLGTPVGSVLVGNTAFIKKSRRLRKAFGGGMRQVGLLAAACSYALEHHVPLLAHDHARASTLAAALALLPYLDHVLPTHTNIIIFELKKAIIVTDFLTYLSENNLHAVAFGAQKVRFVLHHQIEDTMIEKTIQILNNYTQ